MNPFHRWMKKLIGKNVKINCTSAGDQDSYEGKMMLAEPELTMVKEKDKMYIVRNSCIIDISFDRDLLKKRSGSKRTGSDPYCKWLKRLVNKDVKINISVDKEGFVYRGKVIRTDRDLCLFEESGEEDKVYIFRIDQIVEVFAEDTSFSLRADVKIEEIDGE